MTTPPAKTKSQTSDQISNSVDGGICCLASNQRSPTRLISGQKRSLSSQDDDDDDTVELSAADISTTTTTVVSVCAASDSKRARAKDYLRMRHPLPVFDDDYIYQEPKEHVYYVRDHVTNKYRRFKGSCTGAIDEHCPKFDREAGYEMMKWRTLDPRQHYYQMTKEQIFAEWEETRDEAGEFGTAMHAAIEEHANGVADVVNDPVWSSAENKPSLDRYLAWHRDYIVQPGEVFGVARNPEGVAALAQGDMAAADAPTAFKGRFYRTELTMFDADYEFAGQSDVLIELPSNGASGGVFVLGDWKRTKKILGKEKIYSNCLRMLAHLPCCSLTKYTVQASLYSLCIRKFCPSIKIIELRLGVFHPNNASYVWKRVEPLYTEAQAILDWRRERFLRRFADDLLDALPRLDSVCAELARVLPQYAPVAAAASKAHDAALNLNRLLHYNKPPPPPPAEEDENK